jgi:hypothetical protein
MAHQIWRNLPWCEFLVLLMVTGCLENNRSPSGPLFSQKLLLHWAIQRRQRPSDLQEVGDLGSNTPRRSKIFECLTGF